MAKNDNKKTEPKAPETKAPESKAQGLTDVNASGLVTPVDAEKQIFESIKKEESESILSPAEFDKRRSDSLSKPHRVRSNDSFTFKAGRDDKGKRYFNVQGMADPKFIYRAAKMKKGNVEYFFLSTSYDSIFKLNDQRELSVVAWLKTGDRYEQSPISKVELKGVVSVPLDEAKEIYKAIQAQGDDPQQ